MTHMKKPQLEDGYLRIANELFEAILSFGFTERQLKVVLSIVRKTYGFNKKEDDLSASQIGDLCGIKRNHVTETLGQLAAMGVINKRQGNFGMIIGINKSYQSWGIQESSASPKLGLVPNQDSPDLGLAKVVPIRDTGSPELGQVDSPDLGHTKDNLSKDNQQKTERSKKPRSPRLEICFADWIEKCRQDGVQAVTEDDPIFKYAKEVDLPIDFIRLAWIEFKRKYTTGAGKNKKYKDWRAHFGNAVRENWYGVWFEKDNMWQLTTRGKQIQKEMKGKE